MAMHELELDRHHELADFLRNRRARLSPEALGFPKGTRRRTPGLRREEVAMLAGVSPEWYTWLEQGRDINVSVQLLESLARVLQLDANERAHLFFLALKQPPPVETFSPPVVSPILQQILDQLGPIPACFMDARMNVVAHNKAYRVVFVPPSSEPRSERDHNLIWRLFTSPHTRERNAEWDELARLYVAQFRAGYGRFSEDPWWTDMIADLNRVSPEFRELWPRHDVINVAEGRKTFQHPLVGEMSFNSLWLQTVDSSDLRVLLHTPRSNTDTAEKIERLLACEADRETYNPEQVATV